MNPRQRQSSEKYRFPLAEPERVPVELLINRKDYSDLDSFVLSLALVFNDLKGLLLFLNELGTEPPEKDKELSGPVGEWTGLKIQITKLLCGLLHEFLMLIQEHENVVKGMEFKELLQKLDASGRRCWQGIVDVATEEKGGQKNAFLKFLTRVRNNVAFHYHQPKELVKGFNKFFYKNPKNLRNKNAWMSLGSTMEQSRFYFADAAVSGYLQELETGTGRKNLDKQLIEFIRNINGVLMPLVVAHIRRKKVNLDFA